MKDRCIPSPVCPSHMQTKQLHAPPVPASPLRNPLFQTLISQPDSLLVTEQN